MRENLLLIRGTTPQRVHLRNGASFLARCKRISRWNLPSNVTIRQTRTIGVRNRRTKKKRVTFADTATQKIAKRIVKKKENNKEKMFKKVEACWGI